MRRVLLPHIIADEPAPAGAVQDFHGASMGTSWSVRLAGATLPRPQLQQG
jgi:thiamine biosynthesis lipoprotein